MYDALAMMLFTLETVAESNQSEARDPFKLPSALCGKRRRHHECSQCCQIYRPVKINSTTFFLGSCHHKSSLTRLKIQAGHGVVPALNSHL